MTPSALHPGCKADIVIFNSREINDRASVMDPRLASEGIMWLMAKGQWLMETAS